MKKIKYTFGIDADSREQAIAEAAHSLGVGEKNYKSFTGKSTTHGEFLDVNVVESGSGPDYAIQLTAEIPKPIPVRLVPNCEMYEDESTDLSGIPAKE